MKVDLVIIDDDESIFSRIPDFVRQKYNVIECSNVNSFLNFITSRFRDISSFIALVDINIDNESGVDVVKSLYECGIEFPVIFFSDDSRRKTKADAASVGPFGYVEKGLIGTDAGAHVDDNLGQALMRAEGALLFRNNSSIHHNRNKGVESLILVGSMEHEIRQFLQPITNRAAHLLSITDDYRLIDECNAIASQVDALTQFMNPTFEYIRHGTSLFSLEKFAVKPYITDLYHSLGSAGEDIVLHANIPDYTSIDYDRFRLQQIINNLVKNAEKYGKSPKNIELHCFLENEEVVFEVSNHGEPITDAIKSIGLFNPRFRDAKVANLVEGEGIGLALVRLLAELGQGKAYHKPTVSGNTFGIKLPIT
ncbi:MAG: ATP-binding protein [Pseudomonadota bacterium]